MKHYESISEYNDVIYDSRPVKLDDFISNKYNIVHNELYNDGLNKFLKHHISSYINWKFLYNMFSIMNANSDYVTAFNDEFNNKKSYISQTLNSLEIQKSEFLNEFLEVVNNLLTRLKGLLVDSDILSSKNNIYDIIKLTIGDISDFTFVWDNALMLGSENFDSDGFILSEDDDTPFIFIIDYEDKILNIKFDSNGNWFLKINNGYDYSSLEKYELTQKIVDNTNISLIEQIQNIAIKLFKQSHKIIEIKNTEYWMPSDIIVIRNAKPYSKHVYSLSDFWNYYQKFEEYDISDIKVTKENINDSEVDYVDYINGTANMNSRSNNINYKVKFKYLNKDTKIGSDLLTINTFTSQI